MSLYVIGDLHLSFGENKPMDIFGNNWIDHTEKIKKDWMSKIKESDTVILAGDFSWAMKMQNMLLDFEYLNSMPGKKILLKGNHDYWWTSLTKMKNFLKENNFLNIDFLYNNAFEIEDKIICGTRGWTISQENEEEDKKIVDREVIRLKLSIESGLKQFGKEKEIVAFIHYPPITAKDLERNELTKIFEVLKEYNIKRCYYGHLHGEAIKDAVNGFINGIELKLISSDGVDFKLQKV